MTPPSIANLGYVKVDASATTIAVAAKLLAEDKAASDANQMAVMQLGAQVADEWSSTVVKAAHHTAVGGERWKEGDVDTSLLFFLLCPKCTH